MPDVLAKYHTEVAEGLVNSPQNGVDEQWSHILLALDSASSSSCGLTHRPVNHWISASSLQILDARRSIPASGVHNKARLPLTGSLKKSLRNDHEVWWSNRAAEMEHAANTGNTRKLFHLIRATGSKRVGHNGLYNIYCAFTSHDPEFDYLKSLEIEEKINSITWLGKMTSAHHLLSANDKTVKLWRLSERHHEAYNFNSRDDEGTSAMYLPPEAQSEDVYGPAVPRVHPAQLRVPQFRKSQHLIVEARLRRVFSNAHTYHINAISLNSDQETFLSADDLRINLWHLDVSNQSFTIVDLKPPNMEDLSEVVTGARFHPSLCYLLAYSTSRGVVRLCDMRARALCDNHVLVFEDPRSSHNFGFFADIIGSLSDFRFSHSGQHVLARDYLNLKVWDIRMGDRPCEVYPVHEPFRSQLCMLYENDAIFDKFTCCWSKDDRYLITGSYGRTFRIFDRHAGSESLYSLSPGQSEPFGSTSAIPEKDAVEGEKQSTDSQSLPAGGISLVPQRFICPSDPIGSCLGLTAVCVAPSQLVDHLLAEQTSPGTESCQSRATTGSRTSLSLSISSSSGGDSSGDEVIVKAIGDVTDSEMVAGSDAELGNTAATPVSPDCQQETSDGVEAQSTSRERRSRRKSPHQVSDAEALVGSGSFGLGESCQLSNGYQTAANGGTSYSSASATLDGEVSATTSDVAVSPATDPGVVTTPTAADKSALAIDMLQLRRRIAMLKTSTNLPGLYDHLQVPTDLPGEEEAAVANPGSTTNGGALSLPCVCQLDCHCKLLHMTWHPHQLTAAAISGNQIYVINSQSERRSTSVQPCSASPLPDETTVTYVGLADKSVRCEPRPDVVGCADQQPEEEGRLGMNEGCSAVHDEEEYDDGESEDEDGDYEETEDPAGELPISPDGCHQSSMSFRQSADGEKGAGDHTQRNSIIHPSAGCVPHSPPMEVGRKRRRRQVPNGESGLSAEASGCSSPKKDAPGQDSDSTLPALLFPDDQVKNGSQQDEASEDEDREF